MRSAPSSAGPTALRGNILKARPAFPAFCLHFCFVLFLALLPSSAAGFSQTQGSIHLEPGLTTERSFGAATLVIHVAQKVAEVDLQVKLNGQVTGERKLTPADSSYTLDQRNADAGIQGSLIVLFGYPQQLSTLSGDFSVVHYPANQNGATETKALYRGDLVVWEWPVPPSRQHWTVWLTPELSAEVNLLLDLKQSVEIRFVTVSQVILNVTLAEGVNDVSVTHGYAVGTVRIEPGMTLRLQPSTPIQQGEVSLNGVFSSSSHPDVKYAGAIASWSYLPPRPEKGSFQ